MPEQDPLIVVRAFVDYVKKYQKPTFIGIDPGSTGGIGLISGNFQSAIAMPCFRANVKRTKTITDKERQETGATAKTKRVAGTKAVFNYGLICDIFNLIREVRPLVTSVVLEEIPISVGSGKPGAGAGKAQFRAYGEAMLQRAYAMWPLFLHSRAFRVDLVKPVVWKKKLGLQGKEKEDSRILAMSLFPRAPLSLKQDSDKAEAMLLVEYARRYIHTSEVPRGKSKTK